MRIRSGHIIVAAGLGLAALLGFVLVEGGGTQAAQNSNADPAASVPPVNADPNEVPVLEVEGTEKDLGIVSNSEHTHKPFVIKNKGKAPLQIREVRTSCACTMPHLAPEGLLIPPGGEGSFDIEIDPFRIPNFMARRVITISSNDPTRPQLEVGITSHVDPELVIEPDEVDFGDVPKGSPVQRTVVLRQLRAEPVEVTEMNTFGPSKKEAKDGAGFDVKTGDFNFTVSKRAEDTWAKPGKAEFDLSIALSPNTAAGPLDGKNIFVVTNVKRLAALTIKLKGNVIAPYTLAPLAPQKLNIKPDATAHTYPPAYATVSAECPVRIEDIQPKVPYVHAEAEAGASPNEAKLKVVIGPDAPAGVIETEVQFNVVQGETKYPERVGVRSYGLPAAPVRK